MPSCRNSTPLNGVSQGSQLVQSIPTGVKWGVHEENRPSISLFIDACATGAAAICDTLVYHIILPTRLVEEKCPICHLEAVNVVATLEIWVQHLHGCLVHLHTDNNTVAAIFQLCRGRDSYVQACARELWLMCAHADITLVVSHVPGESLTETADALSHFHMVQPFKGVVQCLVAQGVQLVKTAHNAFQLSDEL